MLHGNVRLSHSLRSYLRNRTFPHFCLPYTLLWWMFIVALCACTLSRFRPVACLPACLPYPHPSIHQQKSKSSAWTWVNSGKRKGRDQWGAALARFRQWEAAWAKFSNEQARGRKVKLPNEKGSVAVACYVKEENVVNSCLKLMRKKTCDITGNFCFFAFFQPHYWKRKREQ